MVIDYSTPEGKLRMRLGDTSDIPIIPSSVYTSVYADNDNDLMRSVIAIGSMILGQLSFRTDRRMGLQLQVWGSQAFSNYRDFLLLTVTNPAFMSFSPIALQSLTSDNRNVLSEFVKDWNNNFYSGTQSQSMALNADIGPNNGSRYGPLGSLSTSAEGFATGSGWVVP